MKRNKIEEVDVNAKERRQFKCDHCGMLCTYDKEYPYNLCYKCNQNLEDEVFSVKLERIKRLKNIIRKQNKEIKQLKTELWHQLGFHNISFKDLYYTAINQNKDLYKKLKEKEKEIDDLEITRRMMCGDRSWSEECIILRKTFDLVTKDYLALIKSTFEDCTFLINSNNLNKEKFYEFYRDLAEKMVDNGGEKDE